jgi:ABC-2 type transport system ATP-binding protein
MDEAEYCHRIALMYRGKVIALGTPAELKHGLDAHSLLNLKLAEPLETMRALENLPGVLDVAIFGGGLHVMVDDLDATSARIRQKRWPPRHRRRAPGAITPSMEDVFVALIEAEERKAA